MSHVTNSKLDLAFILDCTGSMGSYIAHAKANINKIVDEISKAEKCNVRTGLVEYRDHPTQDTTFITNVNDFSDDIETIKDFISKCDAQGGGDFPESVCCGLNDCLNKLKWRDDAIKICILIGDAPPHGVHGVSGDCLPDGCPDANDFVKIVNQMAEKAITLYCAGCEPSLRPYRQLFMALCLITGGKYVPIDDAQSLSDLIIGGSREEISMEALMAQVHTEVIKEAAEKGERVNEEELTKRIHQVLNNRGAKTNKLKVDGKDELEITEEIKKLSLCKTLKEMNDVIKELKLTWTDVGSMAVGVFGGGGLGLGRVRGAVRAKRIAKPRAGRVASTKTRASTKHTTKSKKEQRAGMRRSARLACKNMPNERELSTDEEKSETKEDKKSVSEEELVVDESKAKRAKLEKKSSSINLSINEGVTYEETRRLVKKSIARNKLK